MSYPSSFDFFNNGRELKVQIAIADSIELGQFELAVASMGGLPLPRAQQLLIDIVNWGEGPRTVLSPDTTFSPMFRPMGSLACPSVDTLRFLCVRALQDDFKGATNALVSVNKETYCLLTATLQQLATHATAEGLTHFRDAVEETFLHASEIDETFRESVYATLPETIADIMTRHPSPSMVLAASLELARAIGDTTGALTSRLQTFLVRRLPTAETEEREAVLCACLRREWCEDAGAMAALTTYLRHLARRVRDVALFLRAFVGSGLLTEFDSAVQSVVVEPLSCTRRIELSEFFRQSHAVRRSVVSLLVEHGQTLVTSHAFSTLQAQFATPPFSQVGPYLFLTLSADLLMGLTTVNHEQVMAALLPSEGNGITDPVVIASCQLHKFELVRASILAEIVMTAQQSQREGGKKRRLILENIVPNELQAMLRRADVQLSREQISSVIRRYGGPIPTHVLFAPFLPFAHSDHLAKLEQLLRLRPDRVGPSSATNTETMRALLFAVMSLQAIASFVCDPCPVNDPTHTLSRTLPHLDLETCSVVLGRALQLLLLLVTASPAPQPVAVTTGMKSILEVFVKRAKDEPADTPFASEAKAALTRYMQVEGDLRFFVAQSDTHILFRMLSGQYEDALSLVSIFGCTPETASALSASLLSKHCRNDHSRYMSTFCERHPAEARDLMYFAHEDRKLEQVSQNPSQKGLTLLKYWESMLDPFEGRHLQKESFCKAVKDLTACVTSRTGIHTHVALSIAQELEGPHAAVNYMSAFLRHLARFASLIGRDTDVMSCPSPLEYIRQCWLNGKEDLAAAVAKACEVELVSLVLPLILEHPETVTRRGLDALGSRNVECNTTIAAHAAPFLALHFTVGAPELEYAAKASAFSPILSRWVALRIRDTLLGGDPLGQHRSALLSDHAAEQMLQHCPNDASASQSPQHDTMPFVPTKALPTDADLRNRVVESGDRTALYQIQDPETRGVALTHLLPTMTLLEQIGAYESCGIAVDEALHLSYLCEGALKGSQGSLLDMKNYRLACEWVLQNPAETLDDAFALMELYFSGPTQHNALRFLARMMTDTPEYGWKLVHRILEDASESHLKMRVLNFLLHSQLETEGLTAHHMRGILMGNKVLSLLPAHLQTIYAPFATKPELIVEDLVLQREVTLVRVILREIHELQDDAMLSTYAILSLDRTPSYDLSGSNQGTPRSASEHNMGDGIYRALLSPHDDEKNKSVREHFTYPDTPNLPLLRALLALMMDREQAFSITLQEGIKIGSTFHHTTGDSVSAKIMLLDELQELLQSAKSERFVETYLTSIEVARTLVRIGYTSEQPWNPLELMDPTTLQGISTSLLRQGHIRTALDVAQNSKHTPPQFFHSLWLEWGVSLIRLGNYGAAREKLLHIPRGAGSDTLYLPRIRSALEQIPTMNPASFTSSGKWPGLDAISKLDRVHYSRIRDEEVQYYLQEFGSDADFVAFHLKSENVEAALDATIKRNKRCAEDVDPTFFVEHVYVKCRALGLEREVKDYLLRWDETLEKAKPLCHAVCTWLRLHNLQVDLLEWLQWTMDFGAATLTAQDLFRSSTTYAQQQQYIKAAEHSIHMQAKVHSGTFSPVEANTTVKPAPSSLSEEDIQALAGKIHLQGLTLIALKELGIDTLHYTLFSTEQRIAELAEIILSTSAAHFALSFKILTYFNIDKFSVVNAATQVLIRKGDDSLLEKLVIYCQKTMALPDHEMDQLVLQIITCYVQELNNVTRGEALLPLLSGGPDGFKVRALLVCKKYTDAYMEAAHTSPSLVKIVLLETTKLEQQTSATRRAIQLSHSYLQQNAPSYLL